MRGGRMCDTFGLLRVACSESELLLLRSLSRTQSEKPALLCSEISSASTSTVKNSWLVFFSLFSQPSLYLFSPLPPPSFFSSTIFSITLSVIFLPLLCFSFSSPSSSPSFVFSLSSMFLSIVFSSTSSFSSFPYCLFFSSSSPSPSTPLSTASPPHLLILHSPFSHSFLPSFLSFPSPCARRTSCRPSCSRPDDWRISHSCAEDPQQTADRWGRGASDESAGFPSERSARGRVGDESRWESRRKHPA